MPWPTRDGGEINQIDYVIDRLKTGPRVDAFFSRVERGVLAGRDTVASGEREGGAHGATTLPSPLPVLCRQRRAIGHALHSLQRAFLGLPFNIASVSLLSICCVTQVWSRRVGDHHGDCHLYGN